MKKILIETTNDRSGEKTPSVLMKEKGNGDKCFH